MLASRGILDHYWMRQECEMLGLTDFDINPRHMAEHYVKDERRLLSGRAQMIERLEPGNDKSPSGSCSARLWLKGFFPPRRAG